MSSELVKLFVLVEEVYRNDILPVTSAPPILTGRDLIDLGLSPGPQFKRILSALEGAQVEGEVQNRDEAMGFVETFLMQDDLPTQGKKATTCVK